ALASLNKLFYSPNNPKQQPEICTHAPSCTLLGRKGVPCTCAVYCYRINYQNCVFIRIVCTAPIYRHPAFTSFDLLHSSFSVYCLFYTLSIYYYRLLVVSHAFSFIMPHNHMKCTLPPCIQSVHAY
ncbi:uncharacterized protein NEPG_01501, partial [Nematocida parisii ERTm1]|uniref:uncharacterized protein n=1 Tax=Nematocida parisii (strain ERTm1 / ATCC PRA-289) TaxID=881290 RepID=UPI000264B38F